jgi:hypothetical protein
MIIVMNELFVHPALSLKPCLPCVLMQIHHVLQKMQNMFGFCFPINSKMKCSKTFFKVLKELLFAHASGNADCDEILNKK